MDNKDHNKLSEILKKNFSTGVTVVIVFLICLVLFFCFLRIDVVAGGIAKFFSCIQSVIWGLLIAFLMNPIVRFIERQIKKLQAKIAPDKVFRQGRTRVLAIALALLLVFAVIAVIIIIMVPQIGDAITEIIGNLDNFRQQVTGWLRILESHLTNIMPNSNFAERIPEEIFQGIKGLFEKGDGFVNVITSSMISVAKTVANFLIAVVVGVYVLYKKEVVKATTKKIVDTVFSKRQSRWVKDFLHKANDIFGGFFVGKIIDSLIIGGISFVVISILKLPYPALLSTIIGITNIIPVFGPFIGGAIGAIIIVLIDPIKVIPFLIYVIIIQQIDGSILGPKILGDSMGLSPFWVLFAILLFGGCFGFAGMIFGAPMFALIYYVIGRILQFLAYRKAFKQNAEEVEKKE